MAEGDTIYRAASRLRPALAGATVTRFEAARLAGPRPRPGAVVDDVEAVGKHLLIHFADGWSLRTHLQMHGAWHLYRDGEPWRKPAHLARAVIGVDTGWVAVCFNAPTVELYRRDRGSRALTGLGPDLCRLDEPVAAVVERVVARIDSIAGPDVAVADALLDQRIAAGIGNVYKSEACFAARLDPFTPLAALDADARRALWAIATEQLRANLGEGRRTTHADGLAVYGRRGRPCVTCRTPIKMALQGPHRRSTYWCPRCQP